MSQTQKAIFAGGCFWCMEPPFDKLDGVISTISGYAGGPEKDPSYEAVSSGRTGHLEAVEVTYDPKKVSYSELLNAFWRNIDPTDAGGQFADRGQQYQTAVFYNNETEKELAEASKKELETSGKFNHPIATKIIPVAPFYPAEEYHQDYYQKNPVRYKMYRFGSGRDGYLKKTWGE